MRLPHGKDTDICETFRKTVIVPRFGDNVSQRTPDNISIETMRDFVQGVSGDFP